MRYYAGIGSRNAPGEILDLAEHLAIALANDGWILRSGHAEGMDTAFENGAGREAEIYLPWPSFGGDLLEADSIFDRPTDAAYTFSKRFHPAWDRLSFGARSLHARNAHQVLGYGLDNPVEFVVCWTPDGRDVGGTAQAIRIARAHGIPVHNLFSEETQESAQAIVSMFAL